MRTALLALAAILIVACHQPRTGDVAASTAAPVTAAASAPPVDPSACGALGCRLYDGPADAFRAVLATKPLVLGVGEAHAQKAAPGVASSAKRFTEAMLPELAGKASDLVLELMTPPTGCEQKTQAVKKEMAKVTEKQAETNQNEYVAMGDAAQKLGVEPHLLHPTCDDFKAVTAAGADATDASLKLIARLMRQTAERALARNASRGVEKIVVLYGGALHNDVEPRPEARDYAFGPDLVALTKGRYVELDVFAPELVHDGGLWPKLAWYAHFDRAAHPDKATLFAPSVPSGASFTMLLPVTRPDAGVIPP